MLIRVSICHHDGIGRHDRLKICCLQRRVGSSPTGGTKQTNKQINKQIKLTQNEKEYF